MRLKSGCGEFHLGVEASRVIRQNEEETYNWNDAVHLKYGRDAVDEVDLNFFLRFTLFGIVCAKILCSLRQWKLNSEKHRLSKKFSNSRGY